MRLYAITDRKLFAQSGEEALLRQVGEWARAGVEWVQIREKDLGVEELLELSRRVAEVVRGARTQTRVVVNGAVEVARRVGADGVHLAGGWTLDALREAGMPVSVACHSVQEAVAAREGGASVVVFAPVFEKPLGGEARMAGLGLEALGEVCEAAGPVPVFALGGVTIGNAAKCVAVGAAGVAGIRLFAGVGWKELVGESAEFNV
jgi:thiamine-phosphate pyrophosphorylase